jgi:DNA-binding CsgD family transcriptional regulator
MSHERLPTAWRGALSHREAAILAQILEGDSGKRIAVTLGISETAVSKGLADAALKLGFGGRAELVRQAAVMSQGCHAPGLDGLTSAEREVLELVGLGRSNAEIAILRERSEATIANQVAAILRKTGAGNRRTLIVRLARHTQIPAPRAQDLTEECA